MLETGFEKYSTKTLLTIRENLQHGLDHATEHFIAGTLDTSTPQMIKAKRCPPRVGAQLTLMLFVNVSAVLDSRGAI